MSRLGERGAALVRHMVLRGVPAAPKEYAPRRHGNALADDRGRCRRGTLDSAMMAAVIFGHHTLVEWLLQRGGPVNARADAQSRHTALHAAHPSFHHRFTGKATMTAFRE